MKGGYTAFVLTGIIVSGRGAEALKFLNPAQIKQSYRVKMDIYVGNLSFSTNDEGLWNTFEEYGEVESAKVIRDRETNRSRGFGFVKMATQEAADAAIEALNGAEVEGRVLVVRKAEPRAPRPEGGPRGGGGGGGRGGFRGGQRGGGGDRGGPRGNRGDRDGGRRRYD